MKKTIVMRTIALLVVGLTLAGTPSAMHAYYGRGGWGWGGGIGLGVGFGLGAALASRPYRYGYYPYYGYPYGYRYPYYYGYPAPAPVIVSAPAQQPVYVQQPASQQPIYVQQPAQAQKAQQQPTAEIPPQHMQPKELATPTWIFTNDTVGDVTVHGENGISTHIPKGQTGHLPMAENCQFSVTAKTSGTVHFTSCDQKITIKQQGTTITIDKPSWRK